MNKKLQLKCLLTALYIGITGLSFAQGNSGNNGNGNGNNGNNGNGNGAAWHIHGNDNVTAPALIGPTNDVPLTIISGGEEMITFNSDGTIDFGPTATLNLSGPANLDTVNSIYINTSSLFAAMGSITDLNTNTITNATTIGTDILNSNTISNSGTITTSIFNSTTVNNSGVITSDVFSGNTGNITTINSTTINNSETTSTDSLSSNTINNSGTITSNIIDAPTVNTTNLNATTINNINVVNTNVIDGNSGTIDDLTSTNFTATNVTVNSLSGSGTELVKVQDDGTLERFPLTGNTNHYLRGDGIFSLGAWSTNGNNIVNNNTGSVGIGTNLPQEKLHVAGNIKFDGELKNTIFQTDPNDSMVTIEGDLNVSNDLMADNIITNHFTTDKIQVNEQFKVGNSIVLDATTSSTGGTNRLYTSTSVPTELLIQSETGLNHNTIINNDNAGNVGIGLSNPSYKLDVEGTINAKRPSGAEIQIMPFSGSNESAVKFRNTLNFIEMNGNSNKMSIHSNGRIGIGTNLPSTTLDVNGGARIRGLGGSGNQMVIVSNDGTLSKQAIPTGGAGTLHWASNPGTIEGINYTTGRVGIGTDNPAKTLHVLSVTDFNASSGGGGPPPALSVRMEDKFILVGGATHFSSWDFEPRHTYQPQGATLRIGPPANPIFTICENERIGINTTTPSATLEIQTNDVDDDAIFMTSNNSSNIELFKVKGDGTIFAHGLKIPGGFGSGLVNFSVDYLGRVKCRKVEVTTDPIGDYVFEDDYDLMSLKDLKGYLKKEKHLPGMHSAKDIVDNGNSYEVSDMINRLLVKVEELTLYTLEQEEKIKTLEIKLLSK